MKPFDLELAKAGHPVQTRDGRPARIICYDRKGNKPIVALIYEKEDNVEHHHFYFNDGTFLTSNNTSPEDIVMASTKKEGWINIYRNKDFRTLKDYQGIFRSESDAKSVVQEDDNYITTIKIEWEE